MGTAHLQWPTPVTPLRLLHAWRPLAKTMAGVADHRRLAARLWAATPVAVPLPTPLGSQCQHPVWSRWLAPPLDAVCG
jgi:hypothetical protein